MRRSQRCDEGLIPSWATKFAQALRMRSRSNQENENLLGVAIRRGHDRPDEYGKTDGQEVKRGVVTHAYRL